MLDICKCPNIRKAVNDKSHPCHDIVSVQNPDSLKYQLPEPWNGDVVNAPLLVLSSNPSISEDEHYPTREWKDEKVMDFFANRFDENRPSPYTRNRCVLCSNGQYRKKSVTFWNHIHRQAERALGRKVEAGKDYAITEVVHCKSRDEQGVRQSVNECGDKWMTQIIEMSDARVIMVVGGIAKDWFCNQYKIDKEKIFSVLKISSRERTVLIVPHPNSREEKRSLDKILDANQIRFLNSTLAE